MALASILACLALGLVLLATGTATAEPSPSLRIAPQGAARQTMEDGAHTRLAPPLVMVNYYDDRVGGNYPISHTFWITVNDGGGLVKATAVTTSTVEGTGPDGAWHDGYATAEDEWFPLQPNLIPHDWVTSRSDDGYNNSVRLGTIEGVVNAATDTVSGTITVPWLPSQTLDGDAGAWGFTWRAYTVTLDATEVGT
jgi:hypothetical protein